MSRSRNQELAMKFVDIDETNPDHAPAEVDLSADADTHASPGLRPEVLGDAAQRRTKAMVHAALFQSTGEAPTIGPYQVLKRLGEGGMGVVYAAYDDKLERKVALKLIRGARMRRPEGKARTLREARALARLSHPNVVHVYQVGEVDDEVYVAMEFLTGPTLRAWLAAKPRSWREVLAVFRQAGEGLAAAHRQGVIHRDFKPANVIVGDDGRVRVVDFGLAHFGDDGEAMPALPPAGDPTDVLLTQTGAVLGTPAYMAAEQFAGARGDAKTDQFSFCTALYEALHGQRPYTGDKLEDLTTAVAGGRIQPVKSGHEVPGWLHRVVVRGLQPDPAARWPSMDALLAALNPPAGRMLWKIAAATASSLALLAGGMVYAYSLSSPGTRKPAAANEEAEAQARAAAIRAQDEKLLVEARAASTRDPVEAIRTLAKLAGDDPATWQEARFFAEVAEVRGLPEQVLRAGNWPVAEVVPLAGGGVLGRDELGAVWQWKLSEKTGTQVLPAGAATQLLAARDVPVWAALDGKSVRVFGDDRAQSIDIAEIEPHAQGWRLTPDGRTLVATVSVFQRTENVRNEVHLWDLTRPGSPPRTVAASPMTPAAIADDASVVVVKAAEGLRVVRPREGTETTLKYSGRPWKLSADARFLIAWPSDRNRGHDVIELATGASRRVEAEAVLPLVGSDVLFMRPYGAKWFAWRESLATGKEAWGLVLPGQREALVERMIVDPAREQFAVALGDEWGIGDLKRGELTSFLTVPTGKRPQWIEDGVLMVAVRHDVRIHRPATSPLQMRQGTSAPSTCELAPGGRWALEVPPNSASGEFTRVELATSATTTFRCPTSPKTKPDDPYGMYGPATVLDDTGQVLVIHGDGNSCWWDEQRGARTSTLPEWDRLEALPHGVALAAGTEVQVWTGPETMTHRFTTAGPAENIEPSPSGALLAVRSAEGVQVLRKDTGAAVPLLTNPTPMGKRDLNASALAWSRDSTRLAALDKVEGSLELRVWDVAGEPRELKRHDLKDYPGRPRNLLAFTPSGERLALTARHEWLMLTFVSSNSYFGSTVPDMFNLYMRSETEAVGIEIRGGPVLADIGGEASRLTPNPDFGWSTNPPLVSSEDGSVWTCATLGPGTLTRIALQDATMSQQEVRARIHELAAAL